jgi:hypothetical protein
MRRIFIAVSLLGLSACATGGDERRPALKLSANPSALVSADMTMARLAQQKGLWTAMREHVARDAVIFTPQPKIAAEWMKSQVNPAQSIKWQPHKVFISCDGKTGVTTGAWQAPDKSFGYYTTVWGFAEKQGEPSNEGKWQWVLDHNDILTKPRAAPDSIYTRTASCKGSAPAEITAPPENAVMKQGLSRDQSLSYTWVYRPDKSRSISVSMWNGTAMEEVLIDAVAAPKA